MVEIAVAKPKKFGELGVRRTEVANTDFFIHIQDSSCYVAITLAQIGWSEQGYQQRAMDGRPKGCLLREAHLIAEAPLMLELVADITSLSSCPFYR
ncbi:hypothetical protein L1049_016725 [Liquidambar formosana]|uniref:Uncharacterized protein n=1 Tax=Liquidambar formosana TaxID=63359 RepID=A0AAP0S6V8_LIQFO